MNKLSDTYNSVCPVKLGETIEGAIIAQAGPAVFVDLGPRGTGMIRGHEFHELKDRVKVVQPGKKISAKVIQVDNEQGYIELSFSEAREELVWDELALKKEQGEPLMVKVIGANKGGLLTKVEGVPAFLPVSQLSAEKYPKVEDGDPRKILLELQKFIGQELEVHIFSLDPKTGQIIISERLKELKQRKQLISQFQEGQIVDGQVTAICDFGVFVRFGAAADKKAKAEQDVLEGLIHISELDWQLVENPSEVVKVGQKLQVKILQIKDDKIFLSLKALQENPWQEIATKISKGAELKGKVKKLNTYGAFVEVMPKVQGLCHISEFGSQKKMEETLQVGKSYKFKVLALEPENYKITLGFVK